MYGFMVLYYYDRVMYVGSKGNVEVLELGVLEMLLYILGNGCNCMI